MHLWQGFRNQKGQCNLHTLLEEPCLSDKYLALLNCPYHQWFSFRPPPQVQTSNLQFLTPCMKQQHCPGSDLACSGITQDTPPVTTALPRQWIHVTQGVSAAPCPASCAHSSPVLLPGTAPSWACTLSSSIRQQISPWLEKGEIK